MSHSPGVLSTKITDDVFFFLRALTLEKEASERPFLGRIKWHLGLG